MMAPLPPLPGGGKNYITPQGYARLRAELLDLIDNERPKVVEAVHWAAKQRRPVRERRLHLRQEAAARDRPPHPLPDQAPGDRRSHRPGRAPWQRPGVLRRHGDLCRRRGRGAHVTIKGIDEADSAQGEVSWISPIARALLKARVGDVVKLVTPSGVQEIEVLSVTTRRRRGEA
jgi:transcription elongation factor GreB